MAVDAVESAVAKCVTDIEKFSHATEAWEGALKTDLLAGKTEEFLKEKLKEIDAFYRNDAHAVKTVTQTSVTLRKLVSQHDKATPKLEDLKCDNVPMTSAHAKMSVVFDTQTCTDNVHTDFKAWQSLKAVRMSMPSMSDLFSKTKVWHRVCQWAALQREEKGTDLFVGGLPACGFVPHLRKLIGEHTGVNLFSQKILPSGAEAAYRDLFAALYQVQNPPPYRLALGRDTILLKPKPKPVVITPFVGA